MEETEKAKFHNTHATHVIPDIEQVVACGVCLACECHNLDKLKAPCPGSGV